MASVVVPGLDLAPSVPSRIVTVDVVDMTEGAPAVGAKVDFILPQDLHARADGKVLKAGTTTLELDSQGHGEIRVPCYSNATSPEDWVLLVKKHWAPYPYPIRVPVGASKISLASLNSPVEVPMSMKALVPTDATLTLSEGPVAKGSAAVNGGILEIELTLPPGATPYWLGATPLTANDVLENLAPAVYNVPNSAVAQALGLPTGTNGGLTLSRLGSAARFGIYQTFNSLYIGYYGSSGWREWTKLATSTQIDELDDKLNPYCGPINGNASDDLDLNNYLGPEDSTGQARYWIYEIVAKPTAIANMPPNPWTGFLEVLTSMNRRIFIQRLTYNDPTPETWQRQIIFNTTNTWVYGDWRRVDAADVQASTAGEGFELAVRRQMLTDAFTVRKGGTIGTAGLPAVALRFDHHLDAFQAKILPLLVERGLPWAQAINPENLGGGDDNMSYTQIQAMCISGGGEIWNHGGNHQNASGDKAIHTQIVGSLDALQQGLPKLAIEGWAPPGLAAGGYDGYSPMQTPSQHADTYAGRIITGNHAVVAGYVPGVYRVLDGTNRVGLVHATIDTATSLAAARGWISACPPGMGIALMLHPNYLDQPGYMSTTVLTQLLDWIAAERDAGRLAVISYTGLWAADARSNYRHDLLTIHDATGTLTETVALQRLQGLRGGMRELTTTVTHSNAGTVTTKVGESVKTHAVTAGTHQLLHAAPIPLDAETLTVEISGATNVTNAHLYAV